MSPSFCRVHLCVSPVGSSVCLCHTHVWSGPTRVLPAPSSLIHRDSLNTHSQRGVLPNHPCKTPSPTHGTPFLPELSPRQTRGCTDGTRVPTLGTLFPKVSRSHLIVGVRMPIVGGCGRHRSPSCLFHRRPIPGVRPAILKDRGVIPHGCCRLGSSAMGELSMVIALDFAMQR